MGAMFTDTNFNQNTNAWNTSAARDMAVLFEDARTFNQNTN